MLYVIHGSDTDKTRKKLRGMLDVLQSKRPDATLFKVTSESFNVASLEEMVSGMNLFAPKNIIVIDSLVSHKEHGDAVLGKIADFAASDHVCILFDKKLTKEQLKKIEKKAEKIEEHSLKSDEDGASKFSKKADSGHNPFTFAEALVARDKVRSWSLFQGLMRAEIPAEEIHGILWWQFKSIFLSYEYENAKDAGLNPYVYKKCVDVQKKWTKVEVEKALDALVAMYHRAHRGEADFKAELEMLCLR